MISSYHILLIENDHDDALILKNMIKKLSSTSPPLHCKTKHAKSIEEAFALLKKQSFQLILVNFFVPLSATVDNAGVQTFLELHQRAYHIPIIILGHMNNNPLVEEAIRLGAQDYIPKSELNVNLLSRTIAYAIERQHIQENLKELSFTDELTQLYNRRGVWTLLEQQVALSLRMHKGFYLILIDLDFLKEINDTFGHATGDQALIDTAHCLKSAFRSHDVIGRIGGDEFTIVVLNSHPNNEERFKQHLLEKVAAYNAKKSSSFTLSLSIGATFFDPEKNKPIEKLFKEADKDLYQAKRKTHQSRNPR